MGQKNPTMLTACIGYAIIHTQINWIVVLLSVNKLFNKALLLFHMIFKFLTIYAVYYHRAFLRTSVSSDTLNLWLFFITILRLQNDCVSERLHDVFTDRADLIRRYLCWRYCEGANICLGYCVFLPNTVERDWYTWNTSKKNTWNGYNCNLAKLNLIVFLNYYTVAKCWVFEFHRRVFAEYRIKSVFLALFRHRHT